MKLCDKGHEEVCYDSRHCPACEWRSQAEDRKEQIESLENKVSGLQGEVDTLKAEINDLNSRKVH